MSTEVTLAEAREFLTRQIADWKNGWTNAIGPDKGKITEKSALRAIAVLQFTLKTLPKPTKARRPKFERDVTPA